MPGTQAINTSRQLNLGCGHDIRPGWVNLDSADLPGVDVVHNLDVLPLPFEDARFDEIVCQDVLEHVELVPVMAELHRIVAPGGRLHIRVPHFTARTAYSDPTHRRVFAIDTFSFFVSDALLDRGYYFDFHFASVERAAITFHATRLQPWNHAVQRLVNSRPRMQYYYEATAFARLFPALNVEVTLVR